ncbi:MAG: hypothetical protein COB29_01240, partial [Sulfitobacter sp.]
MTRNKNRITIPDSIPEEDTLKENAEGHTAADPPPLNRAQRRKLMNFHSRAQAKRKRQPAETSDPIPPLQQDPTDMEQPPNDDPHDNSPKRRNLQENEKVALDPNSLIEEEAKTFLPHFPSERTWPPLDEDKRFAFKHCTKYSREKLRIGCINVGKKRNLTELCSWIIHHHKLSILILTETGISSSEINRIKHNFQMTGMIIHATSQAESDNGKGENGVAMVFPTTTAGPLFRSNQPPSSTVSDSRMMEITLGNDGNSQQLTIIATYLKSAPYATNNNHPTHTNLELAKQAAEALSKRVAYHTNKNRKVIVLGDLNIPLTAVDELSRKDIYKGAEEVRVILQNMGLTDAHKRYHGTPRATHKEWKRWNDETASESKIDYILATKSILGHFTSISTDTLLPEMGETDHALLLAEVNIRLATGSPLPKDPAPRPRPRIQVPTEKAQALWSEFRNDTTTLPESPPSDFETNFCQTVLSNGVPARHYTTSNLPPPNILGEYSDTYTQVLYDIGTRTVIKTKPTPMDKVFHIRHKHTDRIARARGLLNTITGLARLYRDNPPDTQVKPTPTNTNYSSSSSYHNSSSSNRNSSTSSIDSSNSRNTNNTSSINNNSSGRRHSINPTTIAHTKLKNINKALQALHKAHSEGDIRPPTDDPEDSLSTTFDRKIRDLRVWTIAANHVRNPSLSPPTQEWLTDLSKAASRARSVYSKELISRNEIAAQEMRDENHSTNLRNFIKEVKCEQTASANHVTATTNCTDHEGGEEENQYNTHTHPPTVKRLFADKWGALFSEPHGPDTQSTAFTDLYRPIHTPEIQQEFTTELAKSITETELNTAINEPSISSAIGPDKSAYGLIKHAGPQVKATYLIIMNACLKYNTVPDSWKTANILLLPKSTNVPSSHIDHHRPISLLSNHYKTFERILRNRIQPIIEKHHLLSEQQYGARPNRTAAEAAGLLIDVLEDANTNNMEAHIVSIDWKKAFDMQSFHTIAAGYRRIGLPENFIKLYTNCMTARTATIHTAHGDTDSFPIERSSLQGSVFGPLSYLVCLDPLLHKLSALPGVDISTTGKVRNRVPAHNTLNHQGPKSGNISAIGFVDDCVGFATSNKGAQNIIDIIEDFAKTIKAELNAGKTVYAVAGQSKEHQQEEKILVGGKIINQHKRDEKFKYLGVTMMPSGSWEQQQTVLYEKVAPLLQRMSNLSLSPNQVKTTVMGIVIPRILYAGSQTALDDAFVSKIDVLIRKTSRTALRLSSTTTNDFLYEHSTGIGLTSLRDSLDQSIVTNGYELLNRSQESKSGLLFLKRLGDTLAQLGLSEQSLHHLTHVTHTDNIPNRIPLCEHIKTRGEAFLRALGRLGLSLRRQLDAPPILQRYGRITLDMLVPAATTDNLFPGIFQLFNHAEEVYRDGTIKPIHLLRVADTLEGGFLSHRQLTDSEYILLNKALPEKCPPHPHLRHISADSVQGRKVPDEEDPQYCLQVGELVHWFPGMTEGTPTSYFGVVSGITDSLSHTHSLQGAMTDSNKNLLYRVRWLKEYEGREKYSQYNQGNNAWIEWDKLAQTEKDSLQTEHSEGYMGRGEWISKASDLHPVPHICMQNVEARFYFDKQALKEINMHLSRRDPQSQRSTDLRYRKDSAHSQPLSESHRKLKPQDHLRAWFIEPEALSPARMSYILTTQHMRELLSNGVPPRVASKR